jgi:hypothetical protein
MAMGSVHRLRHIRVLLASRDPRFVGALNFLLDRHGVETVRTRSIGHLDELIARKGITLAVLDVDGFSRYRPAAVAAAAARRLPVIAMSERPERIDMNGVCLLPKWGPFQNLLAAIDRAHAAARPAPQPRSVWPNIAESSLSARPLHVVG